MCIIIKSFIVTFHHHHNHHHRNNLFLKNSSKLGQWLVSLGSNPDLRDIFQNSSSARNVGDLGTNNYVWIPTITLMSVLGCLKKLPKALLQAE